MQGQKGFDGLNSITSQRIDSFTLILFSQISWYIFFFSFYDTLSKYPPPLLYFLIFIFHDFHDQILLYYLLPTTERGIYALIFHCFFLLLLYTSPDTCFYVFFFLPFPFLITLFLFVSPPFSGRFTRQTLDKRSGISSSRWFQHIEFALPFILF